MAARIQIDASVSAFAMSLIVAIAILSFGPQVWAVLDRRDYYEVVAHSDPAIGTLIRLPTVDRLGRTIPRTNLVLAAVGTCHSCSINSFDPAKLTIPESHSLVCLVEPTASDIDEAVIRLMEKAGAYVVLDPQQSVRLQLNAQWLPRLYGIGENRALAWVQKKPNQLPKGFQYER